MLDSAGILDWVRTAKAGDMAVYARGSVLPRQTAATARRMEQLGLVALTGRRVGREWQYLIQRQPKPFAADRRRARIYPRASAETVILRMIREAIRLHQPCPTNFEFAEAAGLSGRLAASYRLRKLVADGKIALVDHGPFEHRVAIICATGFSTARAPL